jgi:hypothetical protein
MKRIQFWMAWLSTVVLLTGTTSLEGCGSKDSVVPSTTAQQPASAPSATGDQQTQQPPGQAADQGQQQQNQAAAAQNPPQTQLPEVNLTAAGLDEILAPIALYPDPVLALMLQASVNPQEVMDGGNWLALPDNDKLKDAALDEASKKAGFTPVMQGLLHFGPVIDMMCTQFDWTKQLGAAYAADPKSVLDSVQRLRAQAVDTGALKSSPQMKVDVTQDQGKQIIQLEPTDPKVVYVPQYNPEQVYGTTTTTTTNGGTTTTTTTTTGGAPATSSSSSSTVVVQQQSSGVSTGSAVLIGLLSFGAGMAVGAAISNNNYYYPAWGYGGVYYGGRPYYPPPYRPVYYGGWHGGYGYNRPVHYGNNNVNINVNNNYYNRFNNNNNLNANYKPRPVPYNSNPNGAYAKSAGNYGGANKGAKYNGSSNYRGASTYQGANNRQPNTANIQNRPAGANVGNTAVQRPAGNAPNNANVQRPSAGGTNSWKGQSTYQGANKGVSAGNMPARNPSGDRGFGQTGGTRPNTGTMQTSRPTTGNLQTSRPATGNAQASRPAGNTQPAARPASQPANRPTTQQASRPQTGGALAGGSNAKADRAASSRGRESMGTPQRSAGAQGKPPQRKK